MEQENVKAIRTYILRSKNMCRAKARELGHDPSVFQVRKGRPRSICKKCMTSMELSSDNKIIGPMLKNKCTGHPLI